MALSLSKSKLFSLPLSLTRRGYAVGAVDGSAVVGLGRGGSMGSMVGKVEERRLMMNGSDSEASNAWAPHPLTGYYRPANHADEIDPVELRQMLLNNKVRPL